MAQRSIPTSVTSQSATSPHSSLSLSFSALFNPSKQTWGGKVERGKVALKIKEVVFGLAGSPVPLRSKKQKEAVSFPFVSLRHTLPLRVSVCEHYSPVTRRVSNVCNHRSERVCRSTSNGTPVSAGFLKAGEQSAGPLLTRQFWCPTICQIASRLAGELSISHSPFPRTVYPRTNRDSRKASSMLYLSARHFCVACNSETRRFPPSISSSDRLSLFRGGPLRYRDNDRLGPREIWGTNRPVYLKAHGFLGPSKLDQASLISS